jgi:antitoxin (DNA-binding transcriptional repressor) of toxin-antitoxin stability system
MLEEIAAGETYRITRHGHEVGRVLPPGESPPLIRARNKGAMRLSGRPAHELRSATSIDELIDGVKGEW